MALKGTVPKVIEHENFKTSKSQYFYLEILKIQVGLVHKLRNKKPMAFN
jgi:hypothetical protein